MLSPIDRVRKVVECDNGRDAAGCRAIIHGDSLSFVHGREQNVGAEVEVAAIEGWWKATSDVHLEILEIDENQSLVTLRYTLSGTHDGDLLGLPASGRKFHVENCTLLRVVDGKVQNAYRYPDTLGLMTPLGAMPGGS
jgi:nogalonic acid methyl ester cyclase/aklanonic acid methyl ester cyclase